MAEPKGKQKIFCDNYLANGLNGTQAYLDAGYIVKSHAVARAAASRLLTTVNVKEYIHSRLQIIENAKIAQADEVLQTLTRILRREEKEQNIIVVKKPTTVEMVSAKGDSYEKVVTEEVPKIVDTDAKNSDVVRAGEILGKYYKMWTDKVDVNSGDIVVKVGDWDGDEAEES